MTCLLLPPGVMEAAALLRPTLSRSNEFFAPLGVIRKLFKCCFLFFLFWRIGESSRREDFLRARQRPRRNRIRSLSNLSIFIITITRYRGRSRFCFPSSPSSRQNPIALRIFSNRIDRWREKIYINTFLAAHPEIDNKKKKQEEIFEFLFSIFLYDALKIDLNI